MHPENTISSIIPNLPIQFCNRLDKELKELQQNCPCVQLAGIDSYDTMWHRLVRWHLKIPLTLRDMEDRSADFVLPPDEDEGNTHNTNITAIHIDVQFQFHPSEKSIVSLMQRCNECSSDGTSCGSSRCHTIGNYGKVQLNPLPLLYGHSDDTRVSHTLIELTNVILYPLFSTTTHGVLLHHNVPVELRALTLSYLLPNQSMMTNETIRGALWMWIHEPDTATLRYGHISRWDTSRVTNMNYLFEGLTDFNDDISGWNVCHVTSMKGMFAHAKHFNQPIGCWNVSNVKDMQFMFFQAMSFNQVLCSWERKLPSDVCVSDMFHNSQSCDLTIHGVTSHIPTGMITLRIKSLTAEVTDILCKFTDTIEDVKGQYYDHTGHNRFNLNFIFKGRLIADSLTVYGCGLQDTSVIHWTPIHGQDWRYDGLNALKTVLSISKNVCNL